MVTPAAALLLLLLALAVIVVVVVQILRPKTATVSVSGFPHPMWIVAQVPFTLAKRRGSGGKPPTPRAIEVVLTRPVRLDLHRLVGFMNLAGFGGATSAAAGVPLSYPIVEAFRLIIQAMLLPDFPHSVLGSVLARNTTTLARPVTPDEELIFRVRVPVEGWRTTPKGDTEVDVVSEAHPSGQPDQPVWHSVTTAVILNPKRTPRGPGSSGAGARGGSKGAEAGAARWDHVVDTWRVPADAGQRYGALNGDLNPIHLHALTASLFGFKRPIAHALYLVARAEASLRLKHGMAPAYPCTLATEFKRPTLLPATLKVAVTSRPEAEPAPPTATAPAGCALAFAVLTEDGAKEVLTGTLQFNTGIPQC